MDNIISEIHDNPLFAEIRRDLHRHPEIGFQEHRTAKRVAELLHSWGWAVRSGIGETGVVGTLKRGSSTRSIGLRADMDALTMQESNNFDHRSQYPDRMHGCGHDGHTTTLLATAWYLAQRSQFDGVVHCIFQPAEEGGLAGAKAMLQDGLFDQFPCDAVFALHNWPDLPVGSMGVRSGPFMASSNRFRINIAGRGAHASQPELAIDPLICAGHMLTTLHTIVSRNRAPDELAVLSVTQIHGGDAVNVIPQHAWLGGSVRTYCNDTLNMIERRMGEIVAGAAATFGCEAELHFERCYPALENHPAQTVLALDVMREIVGDTHVIAQIPQLMGSEDFAFMLAQRPGCYVLLGNGDGQHRAAGHGAGPCRLHSPSYDFNDAAISLGAAYFVRLAHRFLALHE